MGGGCSEEQGDLTTQARVRRSHGTPRELGSTGDSRGALVTISTPGSGRLEQGMMRGRSSVYTGERGKQEKCELELEVRVTLISTRKRELEQWMNEGRSPISPGIRGYL